MHLTIRIVIAMQIGLTQSRAVRERKLSINS